MVGTPVHVYLWCVCAVPEYYRADNRTLTSLRRHSGTARPLLPSIVPSFLPSFLPHIHPPSLSLHSSLYPSHIPFILCFVSFISSLVYSQWTFSPPHLFTDSQSVILWCLSVCLLLLDPVLLKAQSQLPPAFTAALL